MRSLHTSKNAPCKHITPSEHTCEVLPTVEATLTGCRHNARQKMYRTNHINQVCTTTNSSHLRGAARGVRGAKVGGVLAKGQICDEGRDVHRLHAPAHGQITALDTGWCEAFALCLRPFSKCGERLVDCHGLKCAHPSSLRHCHLHVTNTFAPTCHPPLGSSPQSGPLQSAPAHRPGSGGGWT